MPVFPTGEQYANHRRLYRILGVLAAAGLATFGFANRLMGPAAHDPWDLRLLLAGLALVLALLTYTRRLSPPVLYSAVLLYFCCLTLYAFWLLAKNGQDLRFELGTATTIVCVFVAHGAPFVLFAYSAFVAALIAVALLVDWISPVDATALGFLALICAIVAGSRYRLLGKLAQTVAELRGVEERLREMAFRDPLTGLANRAFLNEELVRAIERAARSNGRVAMLFMDLDGFKAVNDTMGHEAGDALLVEMARRLRSTLRGGDIIARPGGDEFIVLLTEAQGLETPIGAANRLLTVLAEPFELEGKTLALRASIGIAIFPESARAPEELMRHGDVAMYAAKRAGGGRYSVYSRGLEAGARRRARLHRALLALRPGRFQLRYQPRYGTRHGEVTAVEARLHWTHRYGRRFASDAILAAAAGGGQMAALTHWILEQSLADWGSTAKIRLAIAIPPRGLQNSEVIRVIGDTLASKGYAPDRVEVHILDLTGELSGHRLQRGLAELQAIGVRLIVDETSLFGAPIRMPPNYLSAVRLNQRLVRGIHRHPMRSAIARALLEVGETLAIGTLAVGVRKEEERELLLRLGCQELQGRLLGPAVSAKALQAQLATKQVGP